MKTRGSVSFLSPRATTRVALFVAAAFVLIGDVPAWAAPKKKKEREPNGLERIGNFFYRIARRLEQPDLSTREREERDAAVIYHSRRGEPPPVVREGPGTGLGLPPGYPGGNVYYDYPPPPGVTARAYTVRPAMPPVYQTYPEPHLRYPERIEPRPSMTLPVPPEGSVSRQSTVPPRSGMEPENPAYNPDAPFDPPVNSAATKRDTDVRSRVGNPGPQAPAESAPIPPATDPLTKATPAPKPEPQFATPVPGKPGFVYPPGVEQNSKNMLDVRDFSPAQKVKDPRSGKVFLVPPK